MNDDVQRKPSLDAAESQTPCMCGNSMRENRETRATPSSDGDEGRSGKAKGRMPDMHVAGESDGLIVPAKRANKAGTPAAEFVEERGSPKGIRGPEGLAKDTEPKRRVEPAGTCTASKECGFVFRTPDRYYPREEPYEVVLHVRICAGGRPQGRSLPRPRFSCFRAAQNTKNGSDPACRSLESELYNRFDLAALAQTTQSARRPCVQRGAVFSPDIATPAPAPRRQVCA